MGSTVSLDVSKDNLCSVEETLAIFRAVKRGDAIRVKDLVQKTGADVLQARNSQGLTLLHCAVKKSHLEMVRLLLQWPLVDLEAVTPNGETALYLAASRGYTQILLTLLDHGAHPDGGEGRYMTAFDEMMRNFCDRNRQRWDEAMCAMLKRGAGCSHAYLGVQDSVFGWVCCNGLSKCVCLLMTNRKLKYVPKDDQQLIRWGLRRAMQRNKPNVIKQFAEHWNSCFPKLVAGGTTFGSFFHEAILFGELDVVQVFLDHIETLDERQAWKVDDSMFSLTPTQFAIICGHEEIAIALLERGADRDIRQTTICYAFRHGSERLVAYLLDNNTDLPFDDCHRLCPISPAYSTITPLSLYGGLTRRSNPTVYKEIARKLNDMIESRLSERYPMIKLGQLLYLVMTGRGSLGTSPVTRKQELTFLTIASMIQHKLSWDLQKIILRKSVCR